MVNKALKRLALAGMLALVGAPVSAQTFTSTDTPLRLPPSGTTGTTVSSITVADSFNIADLDVNIDYNHTFNGDISATVISPNGTNVNLFDKVGAAANAQNGGYRFDDDSPNMNFGSGNPIPPGTYSPNEALSAFNGEDAQGTWTLQMNDAFGGDSGTLNFWQLLFVAVAPTEDASFADVLAGSSLLEVQATSQFLDLLANRLRGGVPTSARQYAHQVAQFSAAPAVDENPIRLVSTAPSTNQIQQVAYHTNPVYKPRKVLKTQAWVSGFGAQGSVDNGFSYDFGGVAFGAQRQVDCFTTLGLAGNYFNADGGRNAGNVELDSLGFAVYASRQLTANGYFSGILGYSSGDFDTYRSTLTGNALGSTDSDSFQSYFELGRTLCTGDWKVQPHLAFQYVGMSYDGYTETGAASSNLQVAEDNVDSARGIIGTSISKNMCVLGGSLAPIYRIAYAHEFADTNQTLSSQFVGGNALAISGAELGRDFLDLGVGFAYATGSGVTLYADYDAQFTSEHDQHSGQGGLMFAW
ncbi:autotransporter domain-containing protein [Stieleria sp. JC731]|uniref:autotransporter domain-containing protein n=1 Tax=Pirellulaceae TaxID=2691357 RepID=UPI001E6422F9|nr:autotransporter domain-containing protein [Stieleria sp. JC731]MCC9599783.1 autotransporter domain-containing protein [Stieleria sp. JC731]